MKNETEILEEMKLPQPMGQRILVRASEKVKQIGLIHLPEAAQEKTCTGKIVALGFGELLEDNTRKPFTVQAGQTIIFGKFGGTEVEVGGVKLQLIHESDVLAILPE